MLDHAVVEASAAEREPAPSSGAVPPATLIGHVERMLAASRPAAARPLLEALKRIDPNGRDLGLLEARTLMAEAKVMPALALLDAAIEEAGEAVADEAPSRQLIEMYLLRGQIHIGLGQFARAIDDTAAAVMLDPNSPVPKLRLGVLLVQLGHFDEAITCLREAATGPADPAVMRGLAMAYERAGRTDDAAQVLAQAIATWPKDLELRAAAVMLELRSRHFAQAIVQANQARQDGAINAAIFAMMGDALAYLGRHGEAAEAYHDALKYAPDDLVLQQFATLSLHASHADRAAPSQLRALFDLAAPGFDNSVIARAYRVPGLIRRALQYQIATGARLLRADIVAGSAASSMTGEVLGAGPVLDLGCGTGLVAVAIATFAGPITGYDLSAVMLAAAKMKHIYADLREGDLLGLLASDDRSWPVVVAGDSLLYFGALEAVFAGVQDRLEPGGRFIFSLAELRADERVGRGSAAGWAPTRGGNYAHSEAYVKQALSSAGFEICSFEAEILHHEAEVPVPGWIIVAHHAGAAVEPLA